MEALGLTMALGSWYMLRCLLLFGKLSLSGSDLDGVFVGA